MCAPYKGTNSNVDNLCLVYIPEHLNQWTHVFGFRHHTPVSRSTASPDVKQRKAAVGETYWRSFSILTSWLREMRSSTWFVLAASTTTRTETDNWDTTELQPCSARFFIVYSYMLYIIHGKARSLKSWNTSSVTPKQETTDTISLEKCTTPDTFQKERSTLLCLRDIDCNLRYFWQKDTSSSSFFACNWILPFVYKAHLEKENIHAIKGQKICQKLKHRRKPSLHIVQWLRQSGQNNNHNSSS